MLRLRSSRLQLRDLQEQEAKRTLEEDRAWLECKKIGGLTTSDQADIVEDSLTSSSSGDESSSTISSTKSAKRRQRKLRMAKCSKHKVKINDTETFAVIDPGAEISLISNVLAKKLKLVPSNVSSCEVMTVNNLRIKSYDVYFVRLEVPDENGTSRFFNESFLEVDLP